MTRFNQPLGGNDMPRFGGPATMMRLPPATAAKGLDVGFIGMPMDHRHLQPPRHAAWAAADPRRKPG